MTTRDVRVRIIGDPSSYKKALKESTSASKSFESQTGSLEKSVKRTHTALLGLSATMIGGGGVVFGLESMVEAAKKAQESQDQLAVTMKDAGLSYQANRAEIEKVIAKQSELAAFQKTDLRDSFGKLIVSTKDSGTAMKDLALASDIARGRHISLEAATQIVIKANMGLTGALRRMGIDMQPVKTAQDALTASGEKFTVQQKAAAKALDLAATKQAAIAQLQKTYAGQAAAYGNSSAGAADKFKVSLTNLEVTLGTALLPTLTDGIPHLSKWVNKLNDSGDAARYAKETVSTVKGVVEDLIPVVKTGAHGFETFSKDVGGTKHAVELLGGAFAAWKLSSVITGIGTSSGSAAKGVELLRTRLIALKTLGMIGVTIVVSYEVAKEAQRFSKWLGGTKYGKTLGLGDTPLPAGVSFGDVTALKAAMDSGKTLTAKQMATAKLLGISTANAATPVPVGKKGTGAGIVSTAMTQLGQPYQRGGPAILNQHTDCSGLAQAVLAKNGITVGRTTYQQWTQGTPVMPGDLKAGDLVFFEMGKQGPEHVGVYIGNDQFIEDPHTGASVRISKLSTYPGFVGARRYTQVSSSTTTAPVPKDSTTTTTTAADIVGQGTKKKAKTVPVITGTKLLPQALQLQLARAAGTKSSDDDLAALKAERAELEKLQKTASKAEQVPIADQLARVKKQIDAIDAKKLKTKTTDMAAAAKQYGKDAATTLQGLDAAWKAHVKTLTAAAAQAKAVFDRSYSEAGSSLLTQFDRATSAGLGQFVVTQTTAEKALADFQAQRQATSDAAAAAQRQSDLSTAQTALSALQLVGLGGTDATGTVVTQAAIDQAAANVAAAQDAINQATLDAQEAGLQAAADASRTAADKQTADQQQAYQDQRDAQRQGLQDWLDDQQKALDAGQISWDTFYAALKDKASANGLDVGSAFWAAWSQAATDNATSVTAANAINTENSAHLVAVQAAAAAAPASATMVAGVVAAARAAGYTQSTGYLGRAGIIPGFAKGGITTGPTIAMIGDNPSGHEALIPLDDPRAARALGLGGDTSGKGGKVELVVNLDGRQIARNQQPHLNRVISVGAPL